MTQPHKTILITGATDGIGKALADHYAVSGYQNAAAKLILIGRRSLAEATAIDPERFTHSTYCQADLATLDCAPTIAAWLTEQNISHIDLLIHNAGTGYVGPIQDQPADSIHQLINVNLRTPIALTHTLLPQLQKAARKNSSKIVFISSAAANLPTPDYAVYSATKAALDGFVRNLQIELVAHASTRNITAQRISPGAVRTNMHAKSGANLNTAKFPPVDKIVAQIAATINTNRRAKTFGLTNQLLGFVGKHAAPLLDRLVHARTIASSHPSQPQPSPQPSPQPPPSKDSGHHPRVCTITGAADGIGKALALVFAKSGFVISGVDIDHDRAATTKLQIRETGTDASFTIANLLDPSDLARTQSALSSGPPIDTLIHNAGINAVGHFTQLDLASQLRVLDLNFTVPLLLTANLLNTNQIANGGSLIFLASLSHYVSYPGAAVYAATKDGITSYARSLRIALAPQNINVLTIFPGPTRTAHARRYSPDNSREDRRMSPDQLAERIAAAHNKRSRILIPGAANRILATLGRIAPRPMEIAMRKALLDKLV